MVCQKLLHRHFHFYCVILCTPNLYFRLFSINVKALINVTQFVIKNLLERNVPGSIVNISSQASIVGLNDHTVYCATKGAVDAFTRAAALEYGPKNIRVNAVNPTVILTDMGRLGWSDPKVAGPMLQKIPLRRYRTCKLNHKAKFSQNILFAVNF